MSDANGNQPKQLGQPTDAEEPSSFSSMMFSKDAPKIEPRLLRLIPLKPDQPPTPPMKGTPPRGGRTTRIPSIGVCLFALLHWSDQSVPSFQRTADFFINGAGAQSDFCLSTKSFRGYNLDGITLKAVRSQETTTKRSIEKSVKRSYYTGNRI